MTQLDVVSGGSSAVLSAPTVFVGVASAQGLGGQGLGAQGPGGQGLGGQGLGVVVLTSAMASAAAFPTQAAPTTSASLAATLLSYNDSGPGLAAPKAILDIAEASQSFEGTFPYMMSAFVVTEYTLMGLIVFVNMFVVLSYAYGRAKGYNGRLRLASSGRLVLHLAFADTLVGLGLFYFTIFKFWPSLAARLARYYVPCVLRFAICFFTMFGSHCALLGVALDRYAAIVHTLHYKDVMTTRVSWCVILGCWVVPAAGAGSIFFVNQWRPDLAVCDEPSVVPQFLLMFALPSNVTMLFAISFAHWRVHKEVKAFTLRGADPEFVASTASSRRSHGCRKSAHVLLRVTGTFIVCWTPLDVMLAMYVLVGPRRVLLVLFEASFTLAMTSFVLNPMLYAWKTEAIRRPLVATLVAARVLPASCLTRGPPGRGPGPPGAKAQAKGHARAVGTGVFTPGHNASISVSHSSSYGSASATTTCSVQTTQSSAASTMTEAESEAGGRVAHYGEDDSAGPSRDCPPVT